MKSSLGILATLIYVIELTSSALAACPPGQHEGPNGRCLPGQAGNPFEHAVRPPPAAEPRPSIVAPATPRAAAPPPTQARPLAPPPSIPQAKTGSLAPPGGADRALTAVRAYLVAKDIPPPSIGAYGIVVLRSKPTAASVDRLIRACHSFVAYLPKQQSIPASVPLEDQMVTIWPLDSPKDPAALKDDCSFVTQHYDLYAGDSAISDAGNQGARLDGRGPFLIGWSPSSARGVPDRLVLVVDMSSFESQDSFDQAFLFWKQKVVEDPSLWRRGFSVERVRLALRDFVDHYGSNLLDAVKLSKQ